MKRSSLFPWFLMAFTISGQRVQPRMIYSQATSYRQWDQNVSLYEYTTILGACDAFPANSFIFESPGGITLTFATKGVS